MAVDRRFINAQLTVTGTANDSSSTTPNQQFIVGAAPTGNFAGAQTNDIAQYQNGAWVFRTPAADNLEIWDMETLKIKKFNGTSWEVAVDLTSINEGSAFWIDPVLALVETGASLPGTVAEAGKTFLNLTDGKLYTSTGVDTWDAGVATNDGDRYGSTTDAKIYVKDSGTYTGAVPPDGTNFTVKDVDLIYTYDAQTAALKLVGAKEVPDATYTEKGVVVVDNAGGITVVSGKIGIKRVTGTYKYTLLAGDVAAKKFTLPKTMVPGFGPYVSAAVGGIQQVNGDDFEILLNSDGNNIGTCALSWDSKGLDSVGLLVGDVFILTYPTDNI